MRKVFFALCVVIFVFVGVFAFSVDRITLVTTDGSVINVPMTLQYTNINFSLRSEYGNLTFNITIIDKIILVTNNVHSVYTKKGEIIQGTITSPNIVFPTRYGNLSVPPSEIGKLIVIMSNVSF
jgi:hypothetical protein